MGLPCTIKNEIDFHPRKIETCKPFPQKEKFLRKIMFCVKL